MSLELHWTCDGCGKRDIGTRFDVPSGWTILRRREITHRCPDCAPPQKNSRFGRQVLYWCQRNPLLAAMTSVVILLLVNTTVATILVAFRFDRLRTQIVELENAKQALLELKAAPPRP